MPQQKAMPMGDSLPENGGRITYWNTLYQVMEYAVDASTITPLYVGGERVTELTEESFLEKLFIPRTRELFEEAIVSEMVQSIPVVCVGGERGCGKTSSLVYCLGALREEHPEMLASRIDVKSLYDERAFEGINARNARTVFRKVIRRQLFAKLFPTLDATIELVAWMLAGAPDGTDSFPAALVGDVHDLAIHAQAEASCYSGTRKVRRTCLHEWLSQNHDKFREHFKALQPRMRAAHYVRAFVALSDEYEKLVLVFDNVDRIPGPLQSEFLFVCNDGQLAAEEACTTVIAIRSENMRGELPRPGQNGDIVRVLLPDDEEYPGILLPRIGPDHVEAVLTRRYDFASQLVHGTESAKREQEALRELDRRIADLKKVHSKALRELLENRVCALSNGSMRATLSLYTGFMTYLEAIDRRGLLHLPDISDADPEKHFHTLFFLWLREKGREHGVVMQDVLQSLDIEETPERYSSFASVHHLLMACVLNLTRELSRASSEAAEYPPWNRVWAQMKNLGFSHDRVREAIASLAAIQGEQPRSIELTRDSVTPDQLAETSPARVRLTPMGEELITNVCQKVGYLWWSAATDPDRPIKTGSYFNYSRRQRMHQLYEYCTKLTKVYLRVMVILRKEWLPQYGGQWHARYIEQFAVGGKTQVQRILESCTAFFRNAFNDATANAFGKLQSDFARFLKMVADGADYDELPLDALTPWTDFWKGGD